MVMAVRVHEMGGPEKLIYEDIPISDPGEGEVRVRHTAIGLNFIDVYYREGGYPATPPFTLGMEGAGIVDALGAGVQGLKEGDRIAYASQPVGAYAEARLIKADRVVKLPANIDDKTAAAMMLQGMTAYYLLRRTYEVQSGDMILFHAAAGGVGLIACQWAKLLGATVIGTVGSKEKGELAQAHGCDHPINYKTEDFVARVKDITDGKGVRVVYDSVGKDTFMHSLDCLQRFGLLVSFGQSSGKADPLDILELSKRGSLYVTRPTLFHYIDSRADLERAAGELFDAVASGAIKIEVKQTYALKDAAQAHRDLEGRKTTGSTVLLP